MRYRSTRGGSDDRGFADVLLEGLAPDGGLYVPEDVPEVETPSTTFETATADLMRPFLAPDPLADEIHTLTEAVYGRFRHPDVAPLRALGGGRHLLELFWGPTLSFKDYALQMLGVFFDRVLERDGRRVLVLGATSGDTGSAAIEACRGRNGIDIVILYPDGAVTEVQRRQMTTVADDNVHAVAVEGTFDDCQRMVKEAFSRWAGRYRLTAVNSINWARIMAQAAYYGHVSRRFDEPVHFVVPTGNFGNVLSAHLARRMGAPVGRLTAANNANHGLADLVSSGRLDVGRVTATVAPAMDIQVPSNLERYLYEVVDEDPAAVRLMQERLARDGALTLDPPLLERVRSDFEAAWRPDTDVIDAIGKAHEATGVVLDPHTAIAWSVAEEHPVDGPVVVVATAHPAKFGDVVARALGSPPPLPDPLATALDAPERITRISADMEALEGLLDSAAT